MRLFVALLLTPRWLDALADVRGRLQHHDRPSRVRWVDPANIHLTLRFLGATTPGQLDLLVAALDGAISGAAPPLLAPGALGAFPSLRRPRVVWVGIAEAGGQLHPLQARVEAAAHGAGWEAEARPFHPHLTLGRVRDPRRGVAPELRRALTDEAVPTWDPSRQTRVALMRSHLGAGGARYERLCAWSLRG